MSPSRRFPNLSALMAAVCQLLLVAEFSAHIPCPSAVVSACAGVCWCHPSASGSVSG